MSISSRIHDTIEDWRKEWTLPLKGWMASWVVKGIESLFDLFEPELIDEVKGGLTRLREIPDLPDDQKKIIDKALGAKSAFQFAAVLPYLIGIMIGFGMGSARPAMNLGSYQVDKVMKSHRLDPFSIISAWRRDPAKYADLFDDLKDQGWSGDRIEALKFFTLYFPTPAELITWTAKEVFEPDMIAKYGLGEGKERLRRDLFYKAGMDDEQIDNHWIAHWEHASWMQLIEMLHRGIITEQDVKAWFPLIEMAPYWAENLIKIAYTWPTRVDVRRFWDMRTIDEDRLEELYKGMGYRDKNLEDYIKWTKVYTDFPMMMARFTKGWITEDDVYNWLVAQGIPEERARYFIEEKVKPEKPERTATERDLTRADFIKGIKKGVITVEEGKSLIMDMGYDAEETDFIIAVHVETEGGSPANFAEYKRLSQLWRYSQGLPTERKPEEIAAAEKELAEKYPLKVPLTEEELKVKVDTIRRKRRARQITRDQEIAGLLELGLTVELATAYADNDDLRLRAEKETA